MQCGDKLEALGLMGKSCLLLPNNCRTVAMQKQVDMKLWINESCSTWVTFQSLVFAPISQQQYTWKISRELANSKFFAEEIWE